MTPKSVGSETCRGHHEHLGRVIGPGGPTSPFPRMASKQRFWLTRLVDVTGLKPATSTLQTFFRPHASRLLLAQRPARSSPRFCGHRETRMRMGSVAAGESESLGDPFDGESIPEFAGRVL